jgi:hypothetical protein
MTTMMKTFKHVVGMAWATPVVRTSIQAGIGAGLAVLAAAGTGVLSSGVARLAVGSAVAAVVAKLQEASRG